jgi:acetyltransferase
MTLTHTPIRDANAARHARRHPLDAIFAPRSVAVIGASEKDGSVGRAIMRNLTSGAFAGNVFPINPKHSAILGRRAYRNVSDVESDLDLAVIAAPAACVPQIVGECADAGIPAAIIISAGFRETGAAGKALEGQILAEARRAGIRIVGPNCLGVMNPHLGLNATFAAAMARPGSVGFISQSGALCTAILDWSFREKLGFSAFVSVGSMLDVGWGDLIDYLGDDPRTKSIVLYMESIGEARSFLSAAREVAMSKPIIVIKVGHTEAAGRAAASHTGALTGRDEVLDAAFRRVGALRVNTISELFDMVDVLARQPRPAGPRLTIVTNAGGPGVLATDMLITSGGELATLSGETLSSLDDLLPPHWSHNNPIDVLGDASPDRYVEAVRIASKSPDSDGTLVILTPQAMTDPTETARKLLPLANVNGKPILASWMGGESVREAREVFHTSGIPTFEFPDAAARAFCYMWRYSHNLDALYETPALPPETEKSLAARREVQLLISRARASTSTIRDEPASKRIREAYGIPTVLTLKAINPDEAATAARRLGFPVVLKLLSSTITHKSDVGGVKLNLRDADAVREAFRLIQHAVSERFGAKHFQGVTVQPMISTGGYEVILGSSLDPQLGQVLLFGTGGQLVEVFKDRALGLPPLNTTLARRMIEQTKIYHAFKGVRGQASIDLQTLENYLVRFSELVIDQPLIKEIDINPLLVSGERIIALDARVILHPADVDIADLPRPAIRPYPAQYVQPWTMKDGTAVTIRPIRPEDEPLMIRFHSTLSDQTVHQRYLGTLKLSERVAHQRLRRICFNDFDREAVLVVDHELPHRSHEILGVGRLSKAHGRSEAEFAIVIGTPWQGLGLGTELLRRLVQISIDEKLSRITAQMFSDNREMIGVARKVGFDVRYDEDAHSCTATLDLSGKTHQPFTQAR